MKTVDFYKLPRNIQDRFVGSVMSGFPPAPLLVQKGGTPQKLIWVGLSVLSFVILVVVTRLGYGDLESALSLHSWKAVVLYVGLVFGIGFGLVSAYGQLVREKALPYTAGVYHFPACLIDARSDQFKVYDSKDLSGAAMSGNTVRITFGGGGSFSFLVDATSSTSIVDEVNRARDRAMHATATEDPKELVAVDPLHNPRFSSPVGPRDPYTLKLPPWGKLGVAVALVIGVALGPVVWLLRNSGSDKTLYARATQTNDVVGYKQYLERGDRYKDEVASTLLPRAELREAIKQNTVEALLAFKSSHPSTKIGPEIQAAIRAAMLAELDKAKAQGSLAAIVDFSKKYPEHGIEPELREATHAVYMRELEAYKKKSPNKDKAVVPFVEKLFGWAEKHGPKVEVRFRHKKLESMGRADAAIAKSPSFMGEVSYPSHYFDEKHQTKRQQAIGKLLAGKLDAGLSPELFEIEVGAPVSTEDGPLPDVKVPTLFVTHSEEWSGHNVTFNKPRGAYVFLVFVTEGTFVIPGEKTTVKLRNEQLKPAATSQLKDDEPMLAPGQAEEKVYEYMAHTALETFAEKYLALFFAKEAKKE